MNIIEETKIFVKEQMKDNDHSHDFDHVMRVYSNAMLITSYFPEDEGIEKFNEEEIEIIRLAALLHDVADFKYSKNEKATSEAINSFLSKFNYPEEKIKNIITIVDNVSFKNEIENGSPKGIEDKRLFHMINIVQDADRLDAIGAIGIARCIYFGSQKGKTIYRKDCFSFEKMRNNFNKKEYLNNQSDPNHSIVEHFYDKLFKLKDMMKTKKGKSLAEGRHKLMEIFIMGLTVDSDDTFDIDNKKDYSYNVFPAK